MSAKVSAGTRDKQQLKYVCSESVMLRPTVWYCRNLSFGFCRNGNGILQVTLCASTPWKYCDAIADVVESILNATMLKIVQFFRDVMDPANPLSLHSDFTDEIRIWIQMWICCTVKVS